MSNNYCYFFGTSLLCYFFTVISVKTIAIDCNIIKVEDRFAMFSYSVPKDLGTDALKFSLLKQIDIILIFFSYYYYK